VDLKEMGWNGLGQGHVGCCEYSIEMSGSMKHWEFLEELLLLTME
jgi:hypothetical protein